ncbi:MAG: hypothetical protein ABFS32_12850 [Bacteroidota bacterium]
MKYILLIFTLLTYPLIDVYSQDQTVPADTLYRIELNDGNVFFGKILEIDNEEVVFNNETLGTITLKRSVIVEMVQIVDSVVTKETMWYRDLQSARYFFAPNGYGLKTGESYYQNTMVIVNQFSGAITDNFSIGAGIVPLFLLGGATPVWITPKLSIPVVKDKVNLGVGSMIGYVVGESWGSSFGVVYGSSTFGKLDKNLTIGAGWVFADGETLNAPLINISGLARSGKKSYLMMENYIIIQNGGEILTLSILGGRSMINKAAIDYGLLIPMSSDFGFIAIPWVGFTIPFSKNHQ